MSSPLLWFGNAAKFLKSQLVIPGSTSGNLTLKPADVTTDYTLTMPGTQGGVSTTLSNNGSGTLSWVSGLPAAGTDGQVLKSMNSVLTNSSYFTPYINYVGNAFAETNTNGWSTYADAASNIPVDGTGGTATGLTFSRTTSSPLRDTGTFSIAQANSTSLQGKGVSYDFTIDSADQAKALSIQFDYNASSTFVVGNGTTAPLNDGTTTTNAGNSDIEVFIYDRTNSILIPVSPQVLTANGTNNFTFKGIFQTASNSTSYRLIFHCATTSANATGYTLKYTNVYVGPQYLTQGSPATDWVPYTLTIGAVTTPPTTGTVTINKALWRRVGDSMEIQYTFRQTSAGTAGSGAYLFPLPSGYTIDSTKIDTTTGTTFTETCGVGNAASLPNQIGFTKVYNTTNLACFVGGGFMGVGGNTTLNNATINITFNALVPIAGWSSTTLMSNDACTRVVTGTATRSTNQTGVNPNNSSVKINLNSLLANTVDTTASWDLTNFKYVVPVSGNYTVSGSIFVASTNVLNGAVYRPQIYVNGVFAIDLAEFVAFAATQEFMIGGSVPLSLKAGDYVELYLYGAGNNSSSTLTVNASTGTRLCVTLIQGPSQIATQDSINARYYASATSLSGSLATIVWTTKDYDSANGMSSGVYTIPVSGKYQINTGVQITGTFALNSVLDMQLQKNGTVISEFQNYAGGAITAQNAIVSDIISCLAGDLIRVQLSSSATSPVIASSNTKNFFSITRVGN